MARRSLKSYAPSITALKSALPVSTYLALLHQAALTGFIPRFDQTGKPTGTYDALDPETRIQTARYLIDKVMPDAPRELLTAQVTPEQLTTPHSVAALPDEELRRIAYPETTPPSQDPDALADIIESPVEATELPAGPSPR